MPIIASYKEVDLVNDLFWYIVIRGVVVDTERMGVNYVAVKTMVQLVMKSTHTFLTPGKLVIAVPLDPDWMCGCPGVDDFEFGESYMITGRVHKESNRSGYVLKVYHKSLVTPWHEEILGDMVHNKSEYHRLTFRPNLEVYKLYS